MPKVMAKAKKITRCKIHRYLATETDMMVDVSWPGSFKDDAVLITSLPKQQAECDSFVCM